MSGPVDPFAREPDLDLGARLLDGVRDALLADGLLGLYAAVAALDREDRIRAALALGAEIVTAGVVREVVGTASATASARGEDELSEGEMLLIASIRALVEDGLDAARATVERHTDRELGAILRDGHERIWTRVLAERAGRRRS
jgi:hypothetical protein